MDRKKWLTGTRRTCAPTERPSQALFPSVHVALRVLTARNPRHFYKSLALAPDATTREDRSIQAALARS